MLCLKVRSGQAGYRIKQVEFSCPHHSVHVSTTTWLLPFSACRNCWMVPL